MGFFDDFNAGRRAAGKRVAQNLGRIPTDEEEANRRRLIDLQERDLNSIIPLREQQAIDAQLKRKMLMSQLQTERNLEVGFGLPPGGLAARSTAVGLQGQMAQAALANQQARTVAYQLEQSKIPLKDRLANLKAAFSGSDPADIEAADRVNTAMENAQQAQRAQVVKGFAAQFSQIQNDYGGMVGKPVDLFGPDDPELATDEMANLLLSNPSITLEQAFQQINAKAAGAARQKFMSLTGMQNDLRSVAGGPTPNSSDQLLQAMSAAGLPPPASASPSGTQFDVFAPTAPTHPGTAAGFLESLLSRPTAPGPYGFNGPGVVFGAK